METIGSRMGIEGGTTIAMGVAVFGGQEFPCPLGEPIPFAETSSVSDREHRLHRVKRYPLCTAGILPPVEGGTPS